jgi:hypothetical protein
MEGMKMSEDEEEKKRKRKSKKKSELKEILEMLEMIYAKLANIERTNSSEAFAGRVARLNPRQSYPSYSKPEAKKTKSESSSYGKIAKEPEVHVRERVVYDQELKSMVENIRKRLDEILPQSGEEEEKEKIAETLEKIENELVSQEENKEAEEQGGQKDVEQKETEQATNEQEVEPEEQETIEPKEEAEEEQIKESEPLPIIENEELEYVKAQDVEPEDSVSLYEFFSGREPEEEEYVPETREELKDLMEEMDDPVFWQNVENEIIEKEYKRPEPRLEPENFDEY